jgi:hypothetical protein
MSRVLKFLGKSDILDREDIRLHLVSIWKSYMFLGSEKSVAAESISLYSPKNISLYSGMQK